MGVCPCLQRRVGLTRFKLCAVDMDSTSWLGKWECLIKPLHMLNRASGSVIGKNLVGIWSLTAAERFGIFRERDYGRLCPDSP
jgi:hypothetical protein